MVNVTIPANLSDQEQELQRKFSQLRKIKKQLAQLKAASSRPPDAEIEKKKLKRTTSEAAEAATEQAKKLLKSGIIKVDTSTKAKQFKRARIDRGTTSKESLDYKPYNVSDSMASASPDEGETSSKSTRLSLRESFVSAHRDSGSNPRRGPRIFVRGHGIDEEMLREIFSDVGGAILNINMEPHRHSGFVTFDTVESADEAVSQFNTVEVKGIVLEVEIARRQRGTYQNRLAYDKNNPQVPEPKTVAPADRDVVSYDDDDMFG